MALHVSISAETITHLGNFAVTNSLLTGAIVSAFLLLFALLFASKQLRFMQIDRFQCFVEFIVESIYNLTQDIAGPKKARDFFPLIATSLIFILVNNWAGLIPGVGTIGFFQSDPAPTNETELVSVSQAYAQDLPQQEVVPEINHQDITALEHHSDEPSLETINHDNTIESTNNHHPESATHSKFIPFFRAATADLNTTIALALISVFMTQFFGVKYLGLSYFTKFINLHNGPIFTFVGILELISEFAKIISFAFRLFGNIFAGEVLLAVIAFLIPIVAPIPFLGLEIFVGFIQALVFAMLTLVFTNMATIGHDDH